MRNKLSLARAALWGLIIGFVVFLIQATADGGRDLLSLMRSASPWALIGSLFGQIAWLSLFFVLIAFIRNRFVVKERIRTELMGETDFNAHTGRIIEAASSGATPNDAICATAKALGTLTAFTARRESADFDTLVQFVQNAVAEYARNSEQFMQDNSGLWTNFAARKEN